MRTYEFGQENDDRGECISEDIRYIEDTLGAMADSAEVDLLSEQVIAITEALPAVYDRCLMITKLAALTSIHEWNYGEGNRLVWSSKIFTPETYKLQLSHSLYGTRQQAKDRLERMFGPTQDLEQMVEQRAGLYSAYWLEEGQRELEKHVLPSRSLDEDGDFPEDIDRDFELETKYTFYTKASSMVRQLERIINAPVQRKIGGLIGGKTVENGETIFWSARAQQKAFKEAWAELQAWVTSPEENLWPEFFGSRYRLTVYPFFPSLEIRDNITQRILNTINESLADIVVDEVSAILRGETVRDVSEPDPSEHWTDSGDINFPDQEIVAHIESSIQSMIAKGMNAKQIERLLRKQWHTDKGAGDERYIQYINLRFTYKKTDE